METSRVWDTFPFNDELDVLEMRLSELQEVPELLHVLIEAPLDHQGHAKPLFYAENRERFSAWEHRIVHVVADGLPTAEQNPDPWSREHGQREYAWRGLAEAGPDDIVLHGDLDEIPRSWAAGANPGNWYLRTHMRDHTFAIDWLGPDWFNGTVITRLKNVQSFTHMRYMRNASVPVLDDAGWHMTCLGGPEAIRKKLDSFCHLEMKEMLERGIDGGYFYERGMLWGPAPDFELGAVQFKAVEVNDEWPRWIREGRAPASWYRPRTEEGK
jgi:beta-1,4-mannosyl-glycoprotein beta-1,4-N-acetylglucosaminyltransferase